MSAASDCIDPLWLGTPGGPVSLSPEGAGEACPALQARPWRRDSREVPRLTSRVLCVCACLCECVEVQGLGVGVNLPELGQMLLTSSSQVDSLRGKMASNPPGVRAFGLTH